MHYLNTDAQISMFRDMLNSEIYVDKSGIFRQCHSDRNQL